MLYPFRIYIFKALIAQYLQDIKKPCNSDQILPIRSLRSDLMFLVSLFAGPFPAGNPTHIWQSHVLNQVCIADFLGQKLVGQAQL